MQCDGMKAVPVLLDCEDFYLQKPYRANYYRCENCGMTQQSPIPADVSSFYEAYPIHQKKGAFFRLMRQWIMGACYFDTRKYLAKKEGPAVLVDFGCGDGWFLEASRNPKLSLVGLETDAALAMHLCKALNLPVYSDEQQLLHDHAGKVDVVTMHFVLEHLTDLDKAFATVSKLLKPDGVFYFVIPNISSWEAKLFGKKWHCLDAPRHISFPGMRSLQQLSERSGFEISRHRGAPFPNGIAGSMPVVLGGRFRFSIFVLFLPIGMLLSRLFPNGNMAYWLTKQA